MRWNRGRGGQSGDGCFWADVLMDGGGDGGGGGGQSLQSGGGGGTDG